MTNQATDPIAAPTLPPDLTERIRSLRDCLLTGLVERDTAVRLALLSALSGEHLLLLGPPGTAKSLVAHRLKSAIAGGTYFERLLTRFTVPEELFGPLSIKGLEDDRYERLTTAYLPQASIAFLDEIFKANSAILNSLLTLLNERQFDNGTRREETPLIAVIGASNELPEGTDKSNSNKSAGGGELDALFDRFLLRLHVGPVSKDKFVELLRLRGAAAPEVPEALLLDAKTLLAVQEAAERVDVPADVESMLSELRDWCTREKIAVSDRRWRKIVKLLQVSAVTNGRSAVSIWDCWLLQHCVWAKAEDREKAEAWYAARVGSSAVMNPTNLTKIVTGWESQLKEWQVSQEQKRTASGDPLYVLQGGGETTDQTTKTRKMRGNDYLFLAPDGAAKDYYMNDQLKDRNNRGKGYTVQQLDSLYVSRNQQFAHWAGKAAYLQNEASWITNPGQIGPAMEPKRFSRVELDANLGELREYQAKTQAYRQGVDFRITSLAAEVTNHLWILPEFAEPARSTLNYTLGVVDSLLSRFALVEAGIRQLPVLHRRPIDEVDDASIKALVAEIDFGVDRDCGDDDGEDEDNDSKDDPSASRRGRK